MLRAHNTQITMLTQASNQIRSPGDGENDDNCQSDNSNHEPLNMDFTMANESLHEDDLEAGTMGSISTRFILDSVATHSSELDDRSSTSSALSPAPPPPPSQRAPSPLIPIIRNPTQSSRHFSPRNEFNFNSPGEEYHHQQQPQQSGGTRKRSTFGGITRPKFLEFDESNGSNDGPAAIPQSANMARRRYIRYRLEEFVLISNHNCEYEHKLVNRFGFPSWWWNSSVGGKGGEPGGGSASRSSEERRGPFNYLLAQVTCVHYGEDAQYYTVTREDNKQDQRADAEFMEPIKDTTSLEAAKAAANKKDFFSHIESNRSSLQSQGEIFLTNVKKFMTVWCVRQLRKFLRFVKRQSDACLNGHSPYSFSVRVTGINILVLCSMWYLYVDQLRLAFFPHSADFALAMVSCVVWFVLVLELLFEVFIRPDGYRSLIRSDKAYLPSAMRYLTTFHFILEMTPLLFFIPEFLCVFDSKPCGCKRAISLATCTLMSIYGPTQTDAFYGRAFLCIMRLRIFGLVRHWKKMWINNTFVMKKSSTGEWRIERGKGVFVPQGHALWADSTNIVPVEESITRQTPDALKIGNDNGATDEIDDINDTYGDDYHLTNASKIGTALLVSNSERCLLLVFLISLASLIPIACMQYGGTNHQLVSSVEYLQASNLAINGTDDESCAFFEETVVHWVASYLFETDNGGSDTKSLLFLEIQPVRCDWQRGPEGGETDGTLLSSFCGNSNMMAYCVKLHSEELCQKLCESWSISDQEERINYYEYTFGIRPSVTFSTSSGSIGTYSTEEGEIVEDYFSVGALFNEQDSVSRSILTLFLLQLASTLFVLVSLSVLRFDAGRLVLGPLRRMLEIVAFYAKNPLSPPPSRSVKKENDAYADSYDDEFSDHQLGTYETDKLINAVSKITDLLRKCWGVAGAGIISSNLARQEGGLTTYFNPTVPGEAVYALFAFVAIDKFQRHLHALKGDIMILINDIAAVLHEEVYRWGYEDRGQCNKNLGGAFLMVYRIGTVAEVLEKRKRAEAVIFSGATSTHNTIKHRRKSSHSSLTPKSSRDRILSQSSVDRIDLSTLPGIRAFADRALLGLLKTFAGIHRDETLMNWTDDFRLGAGVHAATIDLIFGMDAGWAVEGAVGSCYKIDATYLSPHVNMASRMMSATKQYGVSLLLSQAVQGLLSSNAKSKLRHIDTVTVKGSSLQQKIFTYDAKVRSDFFLYSKTEDQANLDSERYSPAIWNSDQDLVAMRNHVSTTFIETFKRGKDEYLAGNWPQAIELLKLADKIMFDREVDEGYVSNVPNEHLRSLTNVLKDDEINDASYDDEKYERLALGDGPCQRLIAYMNERGDKAPDDWAGYRPLTSK